MNWRSCLDPYAEQVEVRASHIGMAVSPGVYETVAAALASFRDGEGAAARVPARMERAA